MVKPLIQGVFDIFKLAAALVIAIALYKSFVMATQGRFGDAINDLPSLIAISVMDMVSNMVGMIINLVVQFLKLPLIIIVAVLDAFIALMWEVIPFLEHFDPPSVNKILFGRG